MEDLFQGAYEVVWMVGGYGATLPRRLESQQVYGPYRLDFSIQGEGEKGRYQIAIEIDGHDFHERTKEQASKDKERDRYLQKHNWKVLRFSGSDIYRNCFGCAQEVIHAYVVAHTGKEIREAAAERHMARLRELLGPAP